MLFYSFFGCGFGGGNDVSERAGKGGRSGGYAG